DDLERSLDGKRSVRLWSDIKRTVAHREHVGRSRARLAACREADLGVAAVAERFRLRSAAAAERGAMAGGLAVDEDLGAGRVGTVLANACEVHRRRRLVRLAVLATVFDRSGGAGMGDFDQAVDGGVVGMNPGALDVGQKGPRRAGHAESRMNASPALVEENE